MKSAVSRLEGDLPEINQMTQELRRLPRGERSHALAKLMGLAGDPPLRTKALGACLDLTTEGVVDGRDLTPHFPMLLSIWKDVYEQVRPLQQSACKPEWMIDEDYSAIRGPAELLLDLMGYLPIRQVDESLREGLSLIDPRLKFFAALSLLRNLEPGRGASQGKSPELGLTGSGVEEGTVSVNLKGIGAISMMFFSR